MSKSTRTVTKALAAEEDLLYGEGTAQQVRGENTYTVTKISGFRPVSSITELNTLDFEKFPKAVLSENGFLRFYQHDGANYVSMVPLTDVQLRTTPDTAVSTIGQSTIIYSATTAHNLAALDNGTAGQVLRVVSTNTNTTLVHNATISLKSGANITLAANTGVTLVFTGAVWAEV